MLLKERRTMLGQNKIPATYEKKIDTVIHAASPPPLPCREATACGHGHVRPSYNWYNEEGALLLFRAPEQAHRADQDYRGGQLWLQVSVECTVSRKSNQKSFVFQELLIGNWKLTESWTECIKYSINFRCHSVCLFHIRFTKDNLFGKD